ncbi:MAG: Ig-like domain-containing protein [Dehalococcoidales bacterium]|nr:Ig-like domain-containing protein [Dehalococcoidales bacterium]
MPLNAASGVAVNGAVLAIFTEAMDPATVTNSTFTLKVGTTAIAGTVNYVGVTAVFTPSVNMASGNLYTATISTGVKNLAGNAMTNPYTWSFTSGADMDTTAPTVSSIIPVNAATGIGINSAISVIFSEAMAPLTVNGTTITLTQGTTAVAGTVVYAGVTATFTPATNLGYSKLYAGTVTTGVKDLAGNAMAATYSWNFTTGAAPDNTAPTISSTIPANTATGVTVNSALSAVFSESMNPLTVNTATFILKQGSTFIGGSVIFVGYTATFTPLSALAAGTTYTATITTGSNDLAGNALAENYVWTFTTVGAGGGGGGGPTVDTIAPTVSSIIPTNLATGVGVNSAISAIFSEAMNPLTVTNLTFTLKQGATPVNGTVSYAGVTATFTPLANLFFNTVYTVTITTGVKDLAGNPLAADRVWNFTTGTAPDITAPTVSSTIPADNATGVAVNSTMMATFSEAMQPLTTISFTLNQGATVVLGAVTNAGMTATFTPLANLAFNTVYTATVTTGAKDLAGNALAAAKVWSFTTGAAPDTTAPTVSSTVPADIATGVAVDSAVVATFNEGMQSLTNLSFTLKQGATAVLGAVTNLGLTATFTPDVPLAPNTIYTATITTGAKDLAGNPLAADKVWSFTTAALLPANPTAPVLGESVRFVILASQKVTTTGVTAISNGDIGIIDQARSYYEGFTAGATAGSFTALTNGITYAHDDMPPFTYPAPYASTIAFINQVRTDLGIAYTFLAADPNPGAPTQVCPISLASQTLTRGVYKTASDVTLTGGALHLDAQGDPNSVFIITIGGNLTTGAGGNIVLDNGALAKNVYWRIAGITVIGGGTTFYGNIFSWQQVNLLAGANVTGRLFSVNEQVTLIANTVTKAP